MNDLQLNQILDDIQKQEIITQRFKRDTSALPIITYQTKLFKDSQGTYYINTFRKSCPGARKTEEYKKPTNKEENKARTNRRARNKIFELALNNTWTHFLTLTISPDKYDRYDKESCKNAVLKFFYFLTDNLSNQFKYLFIPELHKDGAIHFHGLLNLSNVDMEFLQLNNSKGNYSSDMITDKFGWNSLKPIETTDNDSPKKIAKYIAKYVTKELDKITSKRFYHSQDLKEYEVLEQFYFDVFVDGAPCLITNADNEYSNMYGSKQTYFSLDKLIIGLKDSLVKGIYNPLVTALLYL